MSFFIIALVAEDEKSGPVIKAHGIVGPDGKDNIMATFD